MATDNLELYEALKRNMDEEAARMLSEALPAAEDLATKADIIRLEQATKADIIRLEQVTKADAIRLEQATKAAVQGVQEQVIRLESGINERFAQLETRMMRWIVVFFVPLWVTILGAVVTIALRG